MKTTNTQRFIGFMSEYKQNDGYVSINDLIYKEHFGHRIGGRICELRKKWGFEFSKYADRGIDFWKLEKVPMNIEFSKTGILRKTDKQKQFRNIEEIKITKTIPEINFSKDKSRNIFNLFGLLN